MQNQTDCKGSFSTSNIKRLAQTHSISEANLWLIGAHPTPPIQPPKIKYPGTAVHSREKLILARSTRKSSCSEITTLFSLKVSNICQIHFLERKRWDRKQDDTVFDLFLFSLLKIQPPILLKTCLTIKNMIITSQIFPLQDIYVVLDFVLTVMINQSSNVINKHSGSSHVRQQAHTLIHWYAR